MFTVNRLVVASGDIILFTLAYFASYWLRFEGVPTIHQELFSQILVPVVFTKFVVFSMNGLYRGPWRYTGVLDLIKIVRSSIISLLIVIAGIVFIKYGEGVSRSVLLLDTILTIAFTSIFRISIRVYFSRQLLKGVVAGILGQKFWPMANDTASRNILIYGSDSRGEMLLRSLHHHHHVEPYGVVGFFDDDEKHKGSIIHGVQNLGTSDDLIGIIDKFSINEVMIASNPEKEIIRKIFTDCRKEKVQCRIIPPYLDMVHSKVGVSQLRDVAIEDFLQRDSVQIDYSQVEGMVRGKRVLVTGAAGSIGSQLCNQISSFMPDEIVCVDNSETPLFYLQQDLLESAPQIKTKYYCSDVTNRKKMDTIFSSHKPQLVFHAAAHKHVPLMEANIDEVIYNNLVGTKNVSDMAHEAGSEVFVFISTDKAVNPANVMGWTKRMGELYAKYLSGEGSTKFLSVRFGNVLGSNGSVIPIFKKQIEKGGPIKVTHEDITRYFMTIPEAVLLILQAAYLGKQGDTMILDMGEPVKIFELAEEMIRMAGFEPGKEIDISFTGLRPGEKMHEELSLSSEKLNKTENPKISVLKKDDMNLDTIPVVMEKVLEKWEDSPIMAYDMLRNGISGFSEAYDSPDTNFNLDYNAPPSQRH